MGSRRTHELWSDAELQQLYNTVHDIDWFEKVKIPNRSEAAIRRRMCQLREEAGIVPMRSGPRAASANATRKARASQASKALLAKLTRPCPAIGHMPFQGHRNQAQVREEETPEPKPKVKRPAISSVASTAFILPTPTKLWCKQCERLVKCSEADACASQWCKAKAVAA